MTPADRLIDDVARRMTAVAASRDFQARTVALIAERQRVHRWWRLAIPAFVAPAAVAVAIAAASRAPVLPALPGSPMAIAARAEALPLPSPEVVIAVTRAPRPAAPGISAAELAWQARRLPALPPPPAIETEAIQPAALTLPLLELKPLATDPLVIESMAGGR